MERTLWQRIRTRAYLFSTGILRRITLGVRAVLVDGDKIFLIRHTYVPGWHFPGGGVEPGESAEDSAAREVLEETGYRLIGRPQLLGFYHVLDDTTNRDYVAVYVCRAFEEAAAFAPNTEIAEGRWFARDALPAGVTAATRRRIAEVFEGTAVSPRW